MLDRYVVKPCEKTKAKIVHLGGSVKKSPDSVAVTTWVPKSWLAEAGQKQKEFEKAHNIVLRGGARNGPGLHK